MVAVGKLKGWPADGCADYAKRLRRHFAVETIEVPEEDMNRRSPTEVLATEAERIFRRIPAGSHVVALDRERGKSLSSEKVSQRLASLGVAGRSDLTLLVGGPLGLSQGIIGGADEVWSFGEITLPHALARVVLLEQLYRAVKIERGERYHW
ncbi:23S rRNA (pseudouridine(1915)-N(3))-methyltransferase RlmH [Rubrobacter tropicus]|uniref:Ribosomal RNA large subunit methyltransferase H n=1 Tax=Rubrobacter tropicus TaxID=2653851 RepID=A0A6G8QFC3_9ACTN|nr:23S rRNA (pseudouridine(1915)-N(3))-methyltransferase RlmH [Rubrobacter tropicus]